MSRGASKAKHGQREHGAAPQPAQLDAVRRLADSGRHDEAIRRLAELRARFPSFKPLLALSWEVEWKAGKAIDACARAWDWAQASPGSRAAQEALRDSALEAGLFALATSVLRRLASLDGKSFDEPAPEIGPFGSLTLDQATQLDLGRMFLTAQRYDAAREILAEVDHPAARNNLALAQQSTGDMDGALATFEDSWQREPRNLFALEWVVRLRLWRHGRDRAAGLVAPLRGPTPLRPEDAYAQVGGLLLLGADADADAAWRAADDADYWAVETTNSLPLRTRFDYLGGIAAHRLGDNNEADRRLGLACKTDGNYSSAALARLTLATPHIAGGISAEIGEFGEWFPASWIGTMRDMKTEQSALEAFLARCDASSDYLGLAAELGGETPRRIALEILKLRAGGGDAAAIAELKSLLARPCGPDKERSNLHVWLTEKGLLARGDIVRLLAGGEVRDIKGMSMTITAEVEEVDFTPAEREINESLHAALHERKLGKALELAQRFRALRPRDPRALGYVATIKEALNHPLEDWEALYREALKIDPGYLFAKTGIAKACVRRGDVEAAREILGALLGRAEYHHSEWRSILLAQIALARATEDRLAVLRLSEAVNQLQVQFG